MHSFNRRPNSYLFTLVVVVLIGYFKVGLSTLFHLDSPLLLFFTGVALSAWYGGMTQGFLAILISMFFIFFYFSTSLMANGLWAYRTILFLIDCTIITLICDRLRKSKTAQKTSEKLRQSQNFLDSVVENIPNMIFVKDAKDLKFVQFNKAGEELIGLSRKDLIGKNDHDLFPKEQADFFIEKDRQVLAGRHVVDIPEEPLNTGQGVRYLHTKKIPLLNKEGQPQYLLGISEDITEKKKAEKQRIALLQEQAARAEAEKTAERMELLSAATAALNESLDIHAMLNSFAKVIIKDLADWCIIDLYEDEDQSIERVVNAKHNHSPESREWRSQLRADLNSNDSFNFVIRTGQGLLHTNLNSDSLRQIIKDKKTLDEISKHEVKSLMIVPLQYYSKVIGACALVSSEKIYTDLDLTLAKDLGRRAALSIANAKLFSKANEASRAKSAFLANISHEIRTPLGAMLGFAELAAEETPAGSDQASYISTILRNGQQLLRLVDEVLDLSKVESDRIEIEKVPFVVSHLMNEVLSLLNVKAQEKGLSLILKPSEELYWKVYSDPLRLRQILLNVIGNAIKFTEKGSVTIAVSSRPSSTNPEKLLLEFSVTDTGIGLTPEQSSHLFQAFTQADSSMTRKFGGTGLGLFLARKLATLLGGDVSLKKSQIGNGSQFQISIEIEQHEGKTQMESSKKGTVLLVDDAPDNRTLVGLYLSRLSVNFEVAENGRQAVEKALQKNFDVVLMDVQMPEMDGFEAVKILREKQYSKPIVALTAHAMKGDRERCLSQGFDDYLFKPLSKDSLQRCLSQYIPISPPDSAANPTETHL